jgi:hypothetical protein
VMIGVIVVARFLSPLDDFSSSARGLTSAISYYENR